MSITTSDVDLALMYRGRRDDVSARLVAPCELTRAGFHRIDVIVIATEINDVALEPGGGIDVAFGGKFPFDLEMLLGSDAVIEAKSRECNQSQKV
jgi:hypothetical protein